MSKILMLTEWYLPGYKAGGPIASIANLATVLSTQHEVYILTWNRDHNDPSPYPVPLNIWIESPQGKVMYWDTNSKNDLKAVLQEIQPDFLYLNSLFSKKFTIEPLLLQLRNQFQGKIVLAVRGMLHPKALAVKPTKKKLFLLFFRLLPSLKKIRFQATDEQEKIYIQQALRPNLDIRIASNLPKQTQTPFRSLEKNVGEMKICIIARVHRIKNLHFFLNCLAKVRGNIILDIFGEKEDKEYLTECEQILSKAPQIKANFLGAIPQNALAPQILNYHFSALPSLGENFGHAIFDSLVAGRPVIISDKTPWRELEKAQAGWDLSIESPEIWVVQLQKMLDMEQNEYDIWAEAAWKLAENYKNNPALIAQSLALFANA